MIEMPYCRTSAAIEVDACSRNREDAPFMRQKLLDGAFVDVGFARGISLKVWSFEGGYSAISIADPEKLSAIIEDYCCCWVGDLV